MRTVEENVSRSSRGLGHRPFTAVTGVRLPYGTPLFYLRCIVYRQTMFIKKPCSASAGIAQLVERNLAKVEVAGSNPVSRSNIKAQSLRFLKPRALRFFCSVLFIARVLIVLYAR